MEVEIKLALTRAEHARLKGLWGPPVRAVEQESFFFDTPDGLLRRKRLALRLRREDGHCFLTLKAGGKRTGATYVRPETECELSTEEARAFRQGRPDWTAEPLAELERALGKRVRLEMLGLHRNERLFFGARGLEVALDETSFPDGSRAYEVECEIEPDAAREAEALLREELARAGVEYKPSECGKYARLLGILGRLK